MEVQCKTGLFSSSPVTELRFVYQGTKASWVVLARLQNRRKNRTNCSTKFLNLEKQSPRWQRQLGNAMSRWTRSTLGPFEACLRLYKSRIEGFFKNDLFGLWNLAWTGWSFTDAFFSMRVRVANDQFTLTSPDRHVQCGLRQQWFEACESNYSRAQIPNSKRNFRINLVKMRWV